MWQQNSKVYEEVRRNNEHKVNSYTGCANEIDKGREDAPEEGGSSVVCIESNRLDPLVVLPPSITLSSLGKGTTPDIQLIADANEDSSVEVEVSIIDASVSLKKI